MSGLTTVDDLGVANKVDCAASSVLMSEMRLKAQVLAIRSSMSATLDRGLPKAKQAMLAMSAMWAMSAIIDQGLLRTKQGMLAMPDQGLLKAKQGMLVLSATPDQGLLKAKQAMSAMSAMKFYACRR